MKLDVCVRREHLARAAKNSLERDPVALAVNEAACDNCVAVQNHGPCITLEILEGLDYVAYFADVPAEVQTFVLAFDLAGQTVAALPDFTLEFTRMVGE